MTRKVSFFLKFLCLFVIIAESLEDDIIGCNGFIKSDIAIDFSKVEIKLFTKQGNFKDSTDSAPNNGYYFIPIYDKGDYVLKVSPPEGWSFEPYEFPVTIDGTDDPCSAGKDINFEFKGFSVLGQVVSAGHTTGSPGISVQLFSAKAKIAILEGFTDDSGHFKFSPVLPGSYTIKISHPKWNIDNKEVNIEVKNGNGFIKPGSLSVIGYDVSGSVTTDNQPITGVTFSIISGCETSSIEGVSDKALDGLVQICHVLSDEKGIFTFPSVAPGSYVLVPHYKGSSTKFDVHPRSLPFTLGYGSLKLTTVFQVKGFTVSGKVLYAPNGKPINGAKVFVNGKAVATTAEDGTYSLESMRAGNYKILATAENVEFKEREVKLSSTTLQDLIPVKYKLCGKLSSPSSSGPYKIEITSESGMTEISSDSLGNYCTYLPAGIYSIAPLVDNAQKNRGLMFSPAKREVTIIDDFFQNINFSQLRSKVRGKINCMSVCPLITVNLKPKGTGPALQTIAKGGSYEFTEVVPGDYDVYVEPGLGWCWEKETQPLSVFDEITEVPDFIQSGFTVTLSSTHHTRVIYYNEASPSEILSLDITPGSTHICVPKPSPYIFEPKSCHGYEVNKIRWSSGIVILNAITHQNVFTVAASEKIDNFKLLAYYKSKENPTEIMPILKKTMPESVLYEIILQLAEGESLMLKPTNPIFLFTPLEALIVGGTDCSNISQPLFNAEKGHIFSGQILTADRKGLPGVIVNVVDESKNVIVTQETRVDGKYEFSPIRVFPDYKVVAVKEGFVLTALENGNFKANKLAEIFVSVKDTKTGEPLHGVLLSLSGEKSYRRNAQTINGTMSFLSLSPGEFFLRPMMKEYKFNPSNKIIKVTEGSTVPISLSGERIAYSGIGRITSLSGQGEGGVIVEAVGLQNCSLLQEESTSNDDGTFRIRGLKPECPYVIKVKEGGTIEKSIPNNITINVGTKDVTDLHLRALRPSTKVDILVYVIPDHPGDLKTLRIKLTREESPDVALHIVKLADYKPSPDGYELKSVVVTMPSVPSDGRGYVLQLESSLSQLTHQYINRPIYFKAIGPVKAFRFPFSPTIKSRDPELSQSSYLTLPLLLLLIFTFYNKDLITSIFNKVMKHVKNTPTSSKTHSEDFSYSEFSKKFIRDREKR